MSKNTPRNAEGVALRSSSRPFATPSALQILDGLLPRVVAALQSWAESRQRLRRNSLKNLQRPTTEVFSILLPIRHARHYPAEHYWSGLPITMKAFRIVCLLLLLPLSSFSQKNRQREMTSYVNPFIGTGGHGHTFPGATVPFGMVQLSPDTRLTGWDGCSGYHYSDHIIYGFSHTHLSGTGISDYGDILLMPTTGEIHFDAAPDEPDRGYASRFSHQNETAHPGYYSVKLDDDNILVELTATTRVGFHRYTFPKTDRANIILDLAHRDKVLDSVHHYCGQDSRRRVSQIGSLGQRSVCLLCD